VGAGGQAEVKVMAEMPQAEIRGYSNDLLEQAAALVRGWHIKKGGYEALAHAIEELKAKP
jgi:hypothetical protein